MNLDLRGSLDVRCVQIGEPRPHWLLDFIQKNPLQCITVAALSYGGLIFFAHFLSIRFFPSLTISDAALLFTAAALIGFLLGLWAFIMLAAPSFALHYWSKRKLLPGLHASPGSRRVSARLRGLWVAIGSVLTAAAIVALSILVSVSTGRAPNLLLWVVTVALLVGLALCLIVEMSTFTSWAYAVVRWLRRSLLRLILLQACIHLTWVAFAIAALAPLGLLNSTQWLNFLPTLLLLVGLLNLFAIAVSHRRDALWGVGGLLAACAFFAAWASANDIVRLLRLGNLPNVGVTLERPACEAARAALSPTSTGDLPEHAHCQLEHVELRTRIGAQHLLRARTESGKVEFTIPSAQVVSLTTANSSSSSVATPTLTTLSVLP